MTRWFARALGITLALTALAASAADKVMSVQVKTGELRESPSFLGRVVTTIPYAERVTVTAQQGAWMKASTSRGAAGWIHSSALTTKKIVLQTGEQAQTAASTDELALAGKGFNSDVEAQFKAQNRTANFAAVDRMETIVIPPAKLADFLREGGVSPKGGAQ